jgi:hypothetical protein
MIDFDKIIQRLKTIISFNSKQKKILDRDIANYLGLTPQYFAVIKRRKKIPYEAIAYFCKQYSINMNWILLEQKPKYLDEKRDSYK